MFYTSYFAKLNRISTEYCPIAISASVPDWYKGKHYKTLCPPYSTFMHYKNDNDWNQYTKEYNHKLSTLDFNQVISDIENLANDADNIVLLCYERPGTNCHRHLVAEWLRDHGYDCEEFIFEK